MVKTACRRTRATANSESGCLGTSVSPCILTWASWPAVRQIYDLKYLKYNGRQVLPLTGTYNINLKHRIIDEDVRAAQRGAQINPKQLT